MGEPKPRRIRPFSNGTQAAEWMDRNCGRCVKGYDTEHERYCCDIQEALDEAGLIGDGSVSADIARRMDAEHRELCYLWRCGEFVRAEFPLPARGGEGARQA